jgi:ubiquinone/menaquinone biosynthesis C-methylase UbiE
MTVTHDAAESATNAERVAREREFWDAHAQGLLRQRPIADYVTGPDDRYDRTVPWLPYFDMPKYVDTMLAEIGDVTGKQVLDLGTGSGFLAALLAARGASVAAVDVSDESLALCRERARVSGLSERITTHNMPGEALGFPDNSFDSVVGIYLLHHLDLARGVAEIHRVLRPGGTAVFMETWGRNRLLMAARSHVAGRMGIERASSDDERPLDREACRILENSAFKTVEYRFPNLVFLRMACYLPSYIRGPLAIWKAADTALGLIPGMRQYSYFSIVTLRK